MLVSRETPCTTTRASFKLPFLIYINPPPADSDPSGTRGRVTSFLLKKHFVKIKLSPTSAPRFLKAAAAVGRASLWGKGSRTIPPLPAFQVSYNQIRPQKLHTVWRHRSDPLEQESLFQAARSTGVNHSYNTGKVSKGTWGPEQDEGRGRERSRLGLVRWLKKHFYKICPSQSSPFAVAGEGPKGLQLKTRGQRNPKPPRHLKSFIHSKSCEHRGAAPRSPRRCRGAMQDCKQRRGQQPGERSSSTGSEASAPPLCLSHIGYVLEEH